MILIACIGIGFGLFSLPTSLLVGPHILADAGVSVAVGTASTIVAYGLRRRTRWAWPSEMAISILLTATTTWAFIAAIQSRSAANIAFYGILAAWFLGLCAAVFRARSA